MPRFHNKNPSGSKYNTVPTEEDWGDYASDLDQNSGHQKFASRTNEEMQQRFRDNLFSCAGELHYMPEIPFRYYMLGFRDFVMAGDFKSEAASTMSWFLSIVRDRLENHPRHIMPIMPELLPAIEHAARNETTFDKWNQIQDLYEKCGGAKYSEQLNAFLRK